MSLHGCCWAAHFAGSCREEDLKMDVLVDELNAYSYSYPTELPSSKFVFKWLALLKFDNFWNLLCLDIQFLSCPFNVSQDFCEECHAIVFWSLGNAFIGHNIKTPMFFSNTFPNMHFNPLSRSPSNFFYFTFSVFYTQQ